MAAVKSFVDLLSDPTGSLGPKPGYSYISRSQQLQQNLIPVVLLLPRKWIDEILAPYLLHKIPMLAISEVTRDLVYNNVKVKELRCFSVKIIVLGHLEFMRDFNSVFSYKNYISYSLWHVSLCSIESGLGRIKEVDAAQWRDLGGNSGCKNKLLAVSLISANKFLMIIV